MRHSRFCKWAFILAISCNSLVAQQPQTQTAPISALNAKYANGVAPGYWPTKGSGLTLNLSGGTAFCSGSVVTYSAGTLTMTASTTNYIYLNTASSCVPAVKTTTFTSSDIPIAQVVTSGSAITIITDVRTPFTNSGGTGGGVPFVLDTGSVNALVANFSPAPTYGANLFFEVLPAFTNTNAVATININGNGAIDIWKNGGSTAIGVGDLVSTVPAIFVLNSTTTKAILLNPQSQVSSSNGSAGQPAFSFSGSPDYGMWVGSGAVRFSRSGVDILDVGIGGISVSGDVGGSTVHAGNGFTGTKTAGSCVLTITAGIITNVTGC